MSPWTDRMTRLHLLPLLLLGLGACASAPETEMDSAWNVELSPYVWVASVEGEVSAGGSSPTVSLDDPLGLEKGAILHGELGHGDWALIADGLYVDYGGRTRELGPLTTTVGIQAGIGKLSLARRLLRSQLGEDGTLDVQLLAGARYAHVELDLDRQGGGAWMGDEDWVDPLVGVRAKAWLWGGLGLELGSDIGGFGVASDLVWSLYLRADWRVSRGFGIFAGYNLLDYDFDEGPDSDTLRYDLRLSGPVLGVAFRF